MHYLRSTTATAILLFAFFSQGGCQSGTTSGSDDSQKKQSQSDMSDTPLSFDLDAKSDSKKEIPENGRDEVLGVQKVTGTLLSSKGNLPMIDGIILDQEMIFEEEGRNWKSEYEALKNKRCTAVGEVIRHWCGPHEQCLEQGYIDYLRNIESIRKGSK
jgi:hypothetical protein